MLTKIFFSLEVPTFLILWRHEAAAIVSISVTNASNALLARGPEWTLSFVLSEFWYFPRRSSRQCCQARFRHQVDKNTCWRITLLFTHELITYCCSNNCGIASWSGDIWIWSGARDQEWTNHYARCIKWVSRSTIVKNGSFILFVRWGHGNQSPELMITLSRQKAARNLIGSVISPSSSNAIIQAHLALALQEGFQRCL